jgi:hypothetical protein
MAVQESPWKTRSAPRFWIRPTAERRSCSVVNASTEERNASPHPERRRFLLGLTGTAVLVGTYLPVEAPYWGIHLDNYWYEALSWDDARSQLNDRTVAYQPGGSVRIVISERRPGAAKNWLETQGHRQGSIVFRLSRSAEPMPEFATQLVGVDELAAG